MKPTKYSLDLASGNPLYQGSTFNLSISATNADGTVYPLSGYTVRSQIRKEYADQEPILTFSVTQAVTAAASAGIISISAASAQTVSMTTDTTYKWDMLLDNGAGTVHTFLYGDVKVIPRVTR